MQRTMSYVAPPKRSLFPTSPLPMEDEDKEEVELTQPIASDEPTAIAADAADADDAPTTPKPTTPKATIIAAAFITPEKPEKKRAIDEADDAAIDEPEEPKHKKHKKMLHVFHDIQCKYAANVAIHCNTIMDAILGLQQIDAGMANDAAAAGYNSHADYVASLFFEDIHSNNPKYPGAATYDQANIMANKVFRNATDVLITEAVEQSTTLFTPATTKAEADA